VIPDLMSRVIECRRDSSPNFLAKRHEYFQMSDSTQGTDSDAIVITLGVPSTVCDMEPSGRYCLSSAHASILVNHVFHAVCEEPVYLSLVMRPRAGRPEFDSRHCVRLRQPIHVVLVSSPCNVWPDTSIRPLKKKKTDAKLLLTE
jgi:hypothetical protein